MRIPASKVYRAFPELDRFPDEQCAAFVAAAARKGRRVVRILLQALAVILSLVVGGFLIHWLLGLLADAGISFFKSNARYMAREAAWMLATFTTMGAAFLLTRDILLRIAIRTVMNRRGACHACAYGLTGLPVSSDSKVICPECGLALVADASLCEIQPDLEGHPRFIPSADASPNAPIPPLFSPKATKRLIRWGLWAPLCLLVFLALLAGSYELFIRWQAGVARAARLGPTALDDLALASQPGVTAADPNAWELFSSVQMALEQADALNDGANQWLNFGMVYDVNAFASPGLSPAEQLRQRDQAIARIHAYRAAGAFDRLDTMARRPRALHWTSANQGQPLYYALSWDCGRAHYLATISAARMHLAAQSGDWDEWLRAFETTLGLSRMIGTLPTLYAQRLSYTIDRTVLAALDNAMRADIPSSLPPKALEAFRRQAFVLSVPALFQGERLIQTDAIATVFENPSSVRFGLWSLLGPNRYMWQTAGRLGFYHENIRAATRIIDHAESELSIEPDARPLPSVPPLSGLVLVQQYAGPVAHALTFFDEHIALRRGLETALALWSFKSSSGLYPPTLHPLMPSFLNPIPKDPWANGPFRYRISPNALAFTLFSVRRDEPDDLSSPIDTRDFIIIDLTTKP